MVGTASNTVTPHPPGAPIDPTFFLSRTVSNVISSVVFGSRFDYQDEQFLKLLRMINESFIEMSTPWAQVQDSPLLPVPPAQSNPQFLLLTPPGTSGVLGDRELHPLCRSAPLDLGCSSGSATLCLPQLYDMYSGIMQYLPGRHNRIYYLIEELKDFIASRVKVNEASFDPQNPRDFIDCFLIKMHQVPTMFPPTCIIPPANSGADRLALLSG